MAEQGFDGSIRIDSRIDESGVNKGMENITDTIRDGAAEMGDGIEQGTEAIKYNFAAMLPFIKGIFGKIIIATGKIHPALLAVAVTAAAMGFGIFKAFQGVLGIIQNVRDKISQLVRSMIDAAKTMVKNFFGRLITIFNYFSRIVFRSFVFSFIRAIRSVVEAASEINGLNVAVQDLSVSIKYLVADFMSLFLPQIKSISAWLLNLVNIIRQVIAALKGQSSYLKVTASGLDEAAGSAKKALGALAGFDEIDVLQQPDKGAAGESIVEEIVEIDDRWQELADRISRIIDKIKGKFLEFWAVILPFREFLNTTFADFQTSFLNPVSNFVLGEGWDEFMRITDRLMENVDWDMLAKKLDRFYAAAAKLTIEVFKGMLTFYDRFLEPMIEWSLSEEGLPRLLDVFTEFVDDVDWDNLNENFGIFLDALSELTIEILDLWISFVEDVLAPIATWVVDEAMPRFFLSMSYVMRIFTAILRALKPLWDWFYEKILVPVANWTSEKFLEFWDKLNLKLDKLAIWMEENPKKVQRFFTYVGVIAVLMVISLVGWLFILIVVLGLLMIAMAPIIIQFLILATVIGGALVVLGLISAFITGVAIMAIIGFVRWIQLLITKWKELVAGFKEGGIKGALNVIIGWFETFVNSLRAGVNTIIRALNSISISIPPIPFLNFAGYTGSINLPEVQYWAAPRLASGAVIPPNAQFLAVLGDQRSGRNLELPEGLMRQIVREELEGMDMGGGEVTINFAGSLGALVRELKPYIEQEDRRMGMSLARGA